MKAINHSWIARDMIGCNVALDLINTVSGWNDTPEDWVPDISSFLAWARISGLLSAAEKNQAEQLAQDFPVAAERVLAALKELRFALWRIVNSLECHKVPKPLDLSVMNEWARRLHLSEELVFTRNKITLAINGDIPPLELPTLRITAPALLLISDATLGRINTCPGRN